ncbi:MAG: isoprenyl transferase [Ignavibacteriae bacterium]|nr:isoprenyl transferase [Ignavibacteriota bacterium]MCB9244307.1 isoprenyl transferase [Ignavibacteriales bacterium]
MAKIDEKDKEIQESLKRSGEIPKHIAIIMDGNGRWAKARGYSRNKGHREGVHSVRDTVEACGQLGVKYLTLYTFSTENWKRPETEVTLLMKLLIRALKDETDNLNKNNVKFICTGDLEKLPEDVFHELLDAIEKTKNNTLLTLNLALSYSGRWDIVNAAKRLAQDALDGKVKADEIDEELFSTYLALKDLPDPDLLIRTGGDYRISNFLLWQAAYSELYIEHSFWPDFRRNLLYKAIIEYQKRERRYGMISEQLNEQNSQKTKILIKEYENAKFDK